VLPPPHLLHLPPFVSRYDSAANQAAHRKSPSFAGLGPGVNQKGKPSRVRWMIRSSFASDLRRGVQHYCKCNAPMSKCTTAVQRHVLLFGLCACGHGSCSIALRRLTCFVASLEGWRCRASPRAGSWKNSQRSFRAWTWAPGRGNESVAGTVCGRVIPLQHYSWSTIFLLVCTS